MTLFDNIEYQATKSFVASMGKTAEIDRVAGIKDILFDDVYSKKNSNTDFLLYVGRDDCRDYKSFEPILQDVTKANKGVYYFNIKQYRLLSLDDNATKEDIEIYENIKKDFDIKWVPSVYRIVNGEIISKFEFLNDKYYKIDNETEKETYFDSYVKKFNNLMIGNY